MEQFKLTVALNRGMDRSDEMAGGFTLPTSPSSLPFFSITAQTPSQLQNSICMLMREKEAILKPPPLSCPFIPQSLPPSTPTAPDQYTHKTGRRDCWCIVSATWSFSVTWFSLVHTLNVFRPCVVPTVALLTFGPRRSGLVGLLTTAFFDGTRLFTYSKAK